MPLGVSSVQWDLRLPWGSNVQWQFQLWQPGGITPFVVAGHTFEYIVRDASQNQVIKLRSDVPGSPSPAGAGLLAVVSNASLAAINFGLYPPATTALVPPLTYYHALWMDYADPVNATNLFWGQWFLDQAVQP